MTIENFKKYIEMGKVKRKSIDVSQADELMKLSDKHLKYVKKQEIIDDSSRFVFKDIYDIMREASQSVMALRGYKPISHEAVVAFLRDIIILERKYVDGFDRYRKLRNRVVYEAKDVEIITCKDAFKFMKEFLLVIKKVYDNEIKLMGE
jgi:hypothetical protein